jgi:GPH family glycoside/pentoside/hexuronide:cation symporter
MGRVKEVAVNVWDKFTNAVAAGPGTNFKDGSKKLMKNREYFSFYVGRLGMGFYWPLQMGWIFYFYTNVMYLSPMFVGAMLAGARLFDGLYDPLMGAIVDRTRTKWGRIRPYFLFTAMPMAIANILQFAAPNFAMQGRMIWAVSTYMLWDVIYTICDMPMWSLPPVLSPNANERAKYITFGNIVGGIAPTALGVMPAVIGAFYTQQAMAFRYIALGISVISMVCFFVMFAGIKERVHPKKEKQSILKDLRNALQNKYLVIHLFAEVCTWFRNIGGAIMIYFTFYVLRDTVGINLAATPAERSAAIGIVGMLLVYAAGLPATIVGALFPWIRTKFKRLENVHYMMINHFINGTMRIILFFVLQPLVFAANPNFTLFLVVYIGMMFIADFPTQIGGNAAHMYLAEAMDYMEWKKGTRNEGSSFSLITLIGKSGGAVTAFLLGLILASVNYTPNRVQSPEAQRTIYTVFFLVPGISALVQIIPYLLFFDFKGEKRERILAELKEKRAARYAAEGYEAE